MHFLLEILIKKYRSRIRADEFRVTGEALQRCRAEARTCCRLHAARLLGVAEYASTCGAIASGTLDSLDRPGHVLRSRDTR